MEFPPGALVPPLGWPPVPLDDPPVSLLSTIVVVAFDEQAITSATDENKTHPLDSFDITHHN